MLAYCGLRAGEVAALRVDDLDRRHDTIRVAGLLTNTALSRPRSCAGILRIAMGPSFQVYLASGLGRLTRIARTT